MPVYEYECECGNEVELIQGIDYASPKCKKCGAGMARKPTRPASIRVLSKGGHPARSKGYKEGYSKEYLKSLPETQ